MLRYVNNKLFILANIATGDRVIVTTMIDGATPNESSYIMTVDKNGAGALYKANPTIRTWLTRDLLETDDTIYFNDVSMIVTDDTKIVHINGEMIRFTTVDFMNNTVSGLVRGVQGSGAKLTHAQYDYAYGISDSKKLQDAYYHKIMNSKVFTSKGDPLQLSNTTAAKFLELGTF
jgi:hypothetical protein